MVCAGVSVGLCGLCGFGLAGAREGGTRTKEHEGAGGGRSKVRRRKEGRSEADRG